MDSVGIVTRGFGHNVIESNPKGEVGAAFGYTQLLGGYDGGQAEYVRVPFANTVTSLKVPDSISKDEQFLFLSDILPTGYFRS